MTDIRVPLEELERAIARLSNVLDLLENGTRPPELDGMLGGAPDVLDAAKHFDTRWKDGREQLLVEGQEIRNKIREVIDAFISTDDRLTESFDQNVT